MFICDICFTAEQDLYREFHHFSELVGSIDVYSVLQWCNCDRGRSITEKLEG